MQLYRDIVQQSLKLTWQHKFLWWFGFFMLLWSAKGTEIETFFSHIRLLTGSLSPFQPTFWQRAQWETLWQQVTPFIPLSVSFPLFVIVTVMALFLLGAVVIGLAMIAQAALIHSFALYEKKGKSSSPTRRLPRLTFDNAVAAGFRHGIAVFAVNVIGKFFSFGLLTFVALSFYVANVSLFIGLVTFFAIGAISLIIALVTRYALHYVVLQNMSPLQAFGAGWNLFIQNVGVTLELLVVAIFGYISATIVALALAASIMFPFVFVALISIVHFGSWVGLYVLYYLFLMVVMYCFVLTSLIFSTWYSGIWTLLFVTLAKKSVRPLAHRFIRGEAQLSLGKRKNKR